MLYLVGIYSHYDKEIDDILGVFTTKEKAKKVITSYTDKIDNVEFEFYIKELELDDTKNLEQEIGNYMI